MRVRRTRFERQSSFLKGSARVTCVCDDQRRDGLRIASMKTLCYLFAVAACNLLVGCADDETRHHHVSTTTSTEEVRTVPAASSSTTTVISR